MYLEDIFTDLSSAELSDIRMGSGLDDCGICGPNDCDRPKIQNSIQLGLTALYKKFRLLEREVFLELQPGKNRYEIKSDYAESCEDAVSPYLFDSEDPLDDRILKIEEIFGPCSTPIDLNTRNSPCSIRTPSDTTISIPTTLWSSRSEFLLPTNVRNSSRDIGGNTSFTAQANTGYPYGDNYTETVAIASVISSVPSVPEVIEGPLPKLRIVYRSNHPDLDLDDELLLPESHRQALLYYVASRIKNPMGLQNEFHTGNSYYAKYVAECQELTDHNYEIDNVGMETKFEDNGWT